ncbi:glycosyltransferase [Jejuia pallidilutea]
MALGLPVVSTNVGGLPFLIKNNVDGILVPQIM